MSRLNHAFSVEYAELYGIECSIILTHMQFWIEQNQAIGRNYHDGRTWMYQTQAEIAACYPYMSEDIVFRTIKKLIEAKILIKGNYNKTPFDKTSWYAFENEIKFTKPINRGMETNESRNQQLGIAEPIPYTKTNTKQKQQQQDAAAGFPNKKIYNSLKALEIPETDILEICTKYDEATVDHAIAWATHPETKLNKSMAAAIKWACQKKPEIPKPKETDYQKISRFFKHYEKYNNAVCYLTQKYIAFERGTKNESVEFNGFFSMNKFKELCKSFQIDLPKELK
jgi:hypothetical protein